MNINANLDKKHMQLKYIFIALCFLCGCSANQHRPIVVGEKVDNYEADLIECQTLASKLTDTKDETNKKTGVGALSGALIGLSEGGKESVAAAVIGAIIAGGTSALIARHELKNSVIKCMQSKGYKVVE